MKLLFKKSRQGKLKLRARTEARNFCGIETLESRHLLSGSLALPMPGGTLAGSANFTGAVSAKSNPSDYRAFTMSSAGFLTMRLSGLSANANLQLIRDANQNGKIDSGEVLASSNAPGAANESIVKSLSAGSYIAVVLAVGQASTHYHLTITADYAGNAIPGSHDVGSLALNPGFADFVGPADANDYYRVTLTKPQTLFVSLGSVTASVGLQLIRDLNNDGSLQSREVMTSTSTVTHASISRSLGAGTYFVRVYTKGVPTNYRLALSQGPPTAAAPSLKIVFDYRFDTSGFFASHPDAVARLADAALAFSAITDHLSAIAPAGANTWSQTFIDPTTGRQRSVDNPTVAADTIVIYVGATSQLHTLELGTAAPGGYTATGSQLWLNNIESRGQGGALSARPTDFGPWGGTIAFSSLAHWNFSAQPPASNQNDFLSVATHEIAHVLGIGTSDSWFTYVSGHDFVGPSAEHTFGGPVPLFDTDDHWMDDLFSVADGHPQAAEMDPTLPVGQRRAMTALDYAGLEDVGWHLG